MSNCTLALSAVPAVPPMPDPPSLAGANSDGGNATCAKTFSTGDGPAIVGKLNDHGTRLDVAAEIAAGMPGVLRGLSITMSGLSATIAPGLAVSTGLVESTGGTKTLAPSMTTYLWLTAGGGVLSATTPAIPTGALVYLGACVAGASAATVDYSGRVEIPGGIPIRRSADLSTPPDATGLPVHLLYAGTLRYLWDGAAWTRLLDAAAISGLSSSSTSAQIVAALQS